jgi:carbamoyl-phosphate synthase large subunit
METLKILITGVGGPTPRSFAIALKRYSKYKHYKLIATDSNPLAIGLYQKDLFDESYVVPLASAPDYWKTIEKIVKAEKIDMAVILPEAEVLVWSRHKVMNQLPCNTFLPDIKIAEVLVNKARMTELLINRVVVPPSITFLSGDKDLEERLKSFGFPFWVRSTSGTSGLGSLKVYDFKSLHNWISINPEVNEFIASRFLKGRNLACKLLYFNGKLLRAASAERVNYIMAKVAPSGITGNTSFGRLLNEPGLVKVATETLDYLFDRLSVTPHGFYTVDFKEDENGKAFITEINVRHVAFTQCFAAAGANFPEDTIRLMDADASFNKAFHMYQFEEGLIFLRDVDSQPVLMKESKLLSI